MVCLMPIVHNYTNYKDDVDHDKILASIGLWFSGGAFTPKSCHETKDPAAHASDADSDTDKDTEELCARAHVPDHAARQCTTRKRLKTGMEGVKHEPQKEHQVKQEPLKHTRQASTARTASVPVKRAAPAAPYKAKPASPEKKRSLYVDTDDSDPELLKTDLSLEVPPAASLAASRTSSRATSALSGLTVSLAVSRANSRAPLCFVQSGGGQGCPDAGCPKRLTHATSAAPSAFSSILGALRAATPVHATMVALSTPRPMVFNRKTRVLYDDLEAAVKEKQPGESMELVQAAEVMPWIRLSAKMLYNCKTHVLYNDLKAAVDEREPGDSMQVVEPGEGVEWISTLGRSTFATMRWCGSSRPVFWCSSGQCTQSSESDGAPPPGQVSWPLAPMEQQNHTDADLELGEPDEEQSNNEGPEDLQTNGEDVDDAAARKSDSSDDDQPEKMRRVVDFMVDDSDWEDLPTGTTTHRSHHPHLPVNAVRKQRCMVAGPNARASAATRKKQRGNRLNALAQDLNVWEAERKERVQELAEKHGMKVAEVRRRMLALSAYGARRKPSTYNAKISRIMARLNMGVVWGSVIQCQKVKRMVAKDPSMLEGFSREEKKEMIADVLAKRDVKRRGTRANNLAAAVNAKQTMDRLMTEITNLAERVGMVGFAMFSRGHIHDKTVPVVIQSWDALDFFLEVLKKDPADVSHLLELWAVSSERGKPTKNKLLGMQQECTGMITTGLCENHTQHHKLVRGKGVGLFNWPEGVDFKRMSLQSAIGPLEKLRDSLKCGTTRWKVLTATKKDKLAKRYEDMVERGGVKVKGKKSRTAKPRKARKGSSVEDDDDEGEEEGDDGGSDADREDKACLRKTATKRKRAATKGKSVQKLPERDDETDERTCKTATKRKRATTKRKRAATKCKSAQKLPERDEDTSDDETDERAPHKAAKAKRKPPECNEDTGNDEEDECTLRKTAKAKRTPKAPLTAREEVSMDDERPCNTAAKARPTPAKGKGKAGAKSSAVKARSAPKLSAVPKPSKPAAVQEKLHALVWMGEGRSEKESGDRDEESKGRGKKRKRMKGDDVEGQRKRKKAKGAPEGDGNARCEHPKPKPLYRTKKTTGPTPACTDEGASPRADENPHDDVVFVPPPIATSTASSGSGGRPNTVRGGRKGPPGAKECWYNKIQ
ncbi:hypothetical protein B0H14DRAFT_2605423 [Mycena olivaceomarginata]|nr:hypothetical protein B0H14DRAFT_2605423 [Mycena olivaceomarginata]